MEVQLFLVILFFVLLDLFYFNVKRKKKLFQVKRNNKKNLFFPDFFSSEFSFDSSSIFSPSPSSFFPSPFFSFPASASPITRSLAARLKYLVLSRPPNKLKNASLPVLCSTKVLRFAGAVSSVKSVLAVSTVSSVWCSSVSRVT
jgi:hypothetical protein